MLDLIAARDRVNAFFTMPQPLSDRKEESSLLISDRTIAGDLSSAQRTSFQSFCQWDGSRNVHDGQECTGLFRQPNGHAQEDLVALMVAGFSDNHGKSLRTADDRPPTDEPVIAIRCNGGERFVIESSCSTRVEIRWCNWQFYCPRLPINVHFELCSDLSAKFF